MTRLSVNINKVATLRNARGKNNPDVVKTALDIIAYGAEGITVHPRPDGRHIRRDDVYALAEAINVEFNIEGYPEKDFLNLMAEIKPAQCTLVPDPPHVLTSNAGWQVSKHVEFLRDVIAQLHAHAIRTSIFIDPHDFSAADLEALLITKTDRVELYTESYATHHAAANVAEVLRLYQKTATDIHDAGIGLNAGHDLDLHNLGPLIEAIPAIQEVSIGHALICDALHYGLKETIRRYLAIL